MTHNTFPANLIELAAGFVTMTDKEMQQKANSVDSVQMFADIRAMSAAIASHAEQKYANGTFITWNEGMGEVGYGTVIEDKGQTICVNQFQGVMHTISKSDVFGISTPEKAREYMEMRRAPATYGNVGQADAK